METSFISSSPDSFVDFKEILSDIVLDAVAVLNRYGCLLGHEGISIGLVAPVFQAGVEKPTSGFNRRGFTSDEDH